MIFFSASAVIIKDTGIALIKLLFFFTITNQHPPCLRIRMFYHSKKLIEIINAIVKLLTIFFCA